MVTDIINAWAAQTPRLLSVVRIMAAFLFMPLFWDAGITTIPEYLGRRYNMSVRTFLADLGLSQVAQRAVLDQLAANPALADEHFVMSREEFDRVLSLRTVELHTGVSVTGPVENFDNVVTMTQLQNQEFRFETQGRIVAERLKKN